MRTYLFRCDKTNPEENRFGINSRSDRIIALTLIASAFGSYYYLSNKTTIELIYLCSTIWFLAAMFFILKVKVFSGIGLYTLYLYCFTQAGFLFQKYYFTFKDETITIVMIYNIVAPLVLMVFYRFFRVKTAILVRRKISQTWVTLLFFVGVASILMFFLSVGRIPLLANDAENFRVQAVSGRGFLVIIADSCIEIAIMLTDNERKRTMRVMLGVLLMLGTGYRSQALTILLMVFITYWIGKGKKYIFRAGLMVLGLGAFYSLLGVFRSGGTWRLQTLYMPALWRLYVNANNFDTIVKAFPREAYLYGRSILMDLAIVLPGAQKSFMLQLKDMLGMTYSGGSFTPGVFGEAYANFGFVGSIIWPLAVLLLVAFLDKAIRHKIDGRVYFVLAFCIGPATSSFGSSYLMGFIPKLLVYLTVVYLSRHKPIRLHLGRVRI